MSKTTKYDPTVAVIGFHHARGPEVERWFGVEESEFEALDREWPLLPFMALSDGSHASTEDFSYFTLRKEGTPPTSLFGISCTRQLDSNDLKNRPSDVTRSTVQKAVVVIADSPQKFGELRERLSMVTAAWFAQRDFEDMEILKMFQESLSQTLSAVGGGSEQTFGLSLRELIHEFKFQTLVLFKCALLQPKMLFFGTKCERLCLTQFALVSLIPQLISNLQDCADPELAAYESSIEKTTSLKSSDRKSLLRYMGLPLQIFGKGSLFGPYTPLQQLDILADYGTKSYIVGSTNSLLLQQRDRYSDVLINLDEHSINITSSSLRAALALTAADRRWIDSISQIVADTWDEADPSRPNNLGFLGSEEFIKLQFEEYLLSLLASVKYHLHLETHKNDPSQLRPDIEGDPTVDFGNDWLESWMRTENFRIFQASTDSHLFDIVEPRHICAGGLTIEDIQRRFAQTMSELHLDERLSNSREAINKTLATSQKKLTSTFNNIWADIDTLRKRQLGNSSGGTESPTKISSPRSTTSFDGTSGEVGGYPPQSPRKGEAFLKRVPTAQEAGAQVAAAGAKAGAYFNSWASWASEKKKGWNVPAPFSPTTATAASSSASIRSGGGDGSVPGSPAIGGERQSGSYWGFRKKEDIPPPTKAGNEVEKQPSELKAQSPLETGSQVVESEKVLNPLGINTNTEEKPALEKVTASAPPAEKMEKEIEKIKEDKEFEEVKI